LGINHTNEEINSYSLINEYVEGYSSFYNSSRNISQQIPFLSSGDRVFNLPIVSKITPRILAYLKSISTQYTISRDRFFMPYLVSSDIYGTPMYWYLLLILNGMKHPSQFNKYTINILNPDMVSDVYKFIVDEYEKLK